MMNTTHRHLCDLRCNSVPVSLLSLARPNFGHEISSSDENGGKSRKDDGKSRTDDGKSRKDDGKSRKDDGKSRKLDLPEDLQRRIESLGGKADPNTVRKLIINMCSVRPFSANELATILGRSRDHVVREYLKRLVERGDLEQTHPPGPPAPEASLSGDL